VKVIVTRAVRKSMREALRRAGSREIGGVLMARQLSAGIFEVADFSLDEISGERAHFVRDTDHHIRALGDFFARTGHDYESFNYLGEWHSHPSYPLRPSSVDLASMRTLVTGERDIDFAVLLIVKIDFFLRFRAAATLHMGPDHVEHVDLTLA
jgi:integrative and conjugative element protein (TIGR02256 family)